MVSACTRVISTGSYSLPFVDRVDECRLICHPDISGLGQECLDVALNNHPEGYDSKDWRAQLQVCTLYCEAVPDDTSAGVLTRTACCAMEKVDSLWADKVKIEHGDCCEVVKEYYGAHDANMILEAGEVARILLRLAKNKQLQL